MFLECMCFTSFPLPLSLSLSLPLASRLMSGQSGLVAHLSHLSDASNVTVVQAAVAAGYEAASNPASLAAVRVEEGSVASFVELHIEQGPLLEEKGTTAG